MGILRHFYLMQSKQAQKIYRYTGTSEAAKSTTKDPTATKSSTREWQEMRLVLQNIMHLAKALREKQACFIKR